MVSMRLTKKLATLAMRSIRPSAPGRERRASRPSMYAQATASYISCPNSNVMLTLTPSAMRARTAGTPAAVPGTLIIRLGRPTACQSRCASAIVASVSCAASGETSTLT